MKARASAVAVILLLTSVTAMASKPSLSSASPSSSQPPNILVILTDDQGWGDLEYNCNNGTAMCAHTPNLKALAEAPGSAYFHRFYAAAGVCSPTRASIMTGRTHQRDCIYFALSCDQEDPAPTCAAGNRGTLPNTEFTFANAAKASPLGDYATIHVGKWHLGDLWDKKLPGMNKLWPVSSPGTAGFDEWLTTEAEVSSSKPNCGCYPVNHTEPVPSQQPVTPCTGRKQQLPSGGHAGCSIEWHGDQCVVAGGVEGSWNYPCTDYYQPNATDSRGVSGLADWRQPEHKIPGDDTQFIAERFTEFLDDRKSDNRPWLAHLCLHSIHEPHPAMPDFYHLYKNDPDYLGTLTQMDAGIGMIRTALAARGMDSNTVIFFTTDNGPHQGAERTNIMDSTNHMLRQCKASIFEGGIRVPGILHLPPSINPSIRPAGNINVTTPVGALDVLPTILDILQVNFTTASKNPDWVIDGTSMLPFVRPGSDPNGPRNRPLPFSFGGTFENSQQAVIDDDWKILTKPTVGQCDPQPGFNFSTAKTGRMFLYNLRDDPHESNDLSHSEPAQLQRMQALLESMRTSINMSRYDETQCTGGAPFLN